MARRGILPGRVVRPVVVAALELPVHADLNYGGDRDHQIIAAYAGADWCGLLTPPSLVTQGNCLRSMHRYSKLIVSLPRPRAINEEDHRCL